MGTPHKGSELAPWSVLLANLIDVAGLGQGVRRDLLRTLDAESAVLNEITRQFVHRSIPLKIVSFTEQRAGRLLGTLVQLLPRLVTCRVTDPLAGSPGKQCHTGSTQRNSYTSQC